jgi:hypothetical protein
MILKKITIIAGPIELKYAYDGEHLAIWMGEYVREAHSAAERSDILPGNTQWQIWDDDGSPDTPMALAVRLFGEFLSESCHDECGGNPTYREKERAMYDAWSIAMRDALACSACINTIGQRATLIEEDGEEVRKP